MNTTIAAAAVGCALTAGLLGATGLAQAAPSGPASVSQAVASLQARGYTVVVNGTGSVPLDRCTTYVLRPGQTYARMDSGSGLPGEATDIVTSVVSMTVYIDARC